MLSVSETKREMVLEGAKDFYRETVYVPEQKDYIKGFLHAPERCTEYQGGLEPVLPPDGIWSVEPNDAWLTVNSYNAVVLNSRNMFIADIDFGDPRLEKNVGCENVCDVLRSLEEISILDEHYKYELRKFSSQTYRVYHTHSGCRVICTSTVWPLDYSAELLMRFL